MLQALKEADEEVGALEDHPDEPACEGEGEAENEQDCESSEGDPDNGDEGTECGADEAAGLIAAGLALGVVASIAARKYLGAESRRPALREAAGPASTLLFWLFVAAGLIAAVASSSPTTIEDIPSDLLGWLPRLGVAGIILIAGFVIATIASTGVARAARRATGRS